MVIAAGGAYVRIWRPKQGLAVELPACAVVDKEGEVLALGESAVGQEGKLSGKAAFVRPFFADRIVHREVLREIFRQALDQSVSGGQPWERWRATLLVPPTVPPLHAQWLEKTLREAGIGWVERRDPLAALVQSSASRSKKTPVMGVLDWGFSQLRAGIYAGGEVLATASAPHLSVSELCRQVVGAEREATHRRFPLADLYGLQWGMTQVAYDEKSARPVAGTLTAKVVTPMRQGFTDGALKLMAKLVRSLPPEPAAFFRQHGWLVVGGGAELIGPVEDAAELLGVPVKIVANAPYALLQGAAK